MLGTVAVLSIIFRLSTFKCFRFKYLIIDFLPGDIEETFLQIFLFIDITIDDGIFIEILIDVDDVPSLKICLYYVSHFVILFLKFSLCPLNSILI